MKPSTPYPYKTKYGAETNTKTLYSKIFPFQDKEFIKAHIKKKLRNGAKLGEADDFPREVDEVRKVLRQDKNEDKPSSM